MFLISSCSISAQDKNTSKEAFSTVVKTSSVMTSAAVNDAFSIIALAGESRDKATSDKNGLLIKMNEKGSVKQALSIGDADKAEKIERVSFLHDADNKLALLLSNTDNRLAVLSLLDKNNTVAWAKNSMLAKSGDGCDLAIGKDAIAILLKRIDEKGNAATFDPFTIQCFSKNGDYLWGKSTNFVEWQVGISSLANGEGFIVGTKGKGYYIDSGAGNEKYFRIPIALISEKGEKVWANVVMFKKVEYDDFYLFDMINNAQGDTYLLGYIQSANTTKKNPFMIQVNKNGTLGWAKIYPLQENAQFKTGAFDNDGNIIAWADSYTMGKNATRIIINPTTGEPIQAMSMEITMFDQIRNFYYNSKTSYLGWDNTLNFALTSFDANGHTCKTMFEQKVVAQNINAVLTSDNKDAYTNDAIEWKNINLNITEVTIPNTDIKDGCHADNNKTQKK